jgi:hypothetical protein
MESCDVVSIAKVARIISLNRLCHSTALDADSQFWAINHQRITFRLDMPRETEELHRVSHTDHVVDFAGVNVK